MKKKQLFFATVWLLIASLGIGQTAWGCWHRPKEVTVAPETGTNDRQVELKLYSKKFSKTLTVVLSREGQPEIVASDVQVLSKNKAVCKVDLRGKAPGKWDMKLENGYRFLFFNIHRPLVIEKAFTVENPAPSIQQVVPAQWSCGSVVEATISGANFRPGATVKLTQSGMELKAERLEIPATDRITARFNLANVQPGNYQLTVMNDDGKMAQITQVVSEVPNQPALSETPQPAAPAQVPDQTGSVVPVKEPSPEAVSQNVKPEKPGPVLVRIFFDFDKAVLRPDQRQVLQEVLTKLKEGRGFIYLGCHADERGTQGYNLKLSGRRGETVRRFLIAEGIPAERIISYSYGEDHPARLGHDEAAWSFNRRVDLLLEEAVLNSSDLLEKVKE